MSDDERFRNAVVYGTSHPEMYMSPREEIERLRAENEKLRERLEKAHSFISRADWMQFFEEEHDAAAALKEPGDE